MVSTFTMKRVEGRTHMCGYQVRNIGIFAAVVLFIRARNNTFEYLTTVCWLKVGILPLDRPPACARAASGILWTADVVRRCSCI